MATSKKRLGAGTWFDMAPAPSIDDICTYGPMRSDEIRSVRAYLVGGLETSEKYVNGKDYPIYYGKQKMFQTTNQLFLIHD